MLGHGALGIWALGQLPSIQSGAAAAPGAVLPLTLALFAGAASGEGDRPAFIIGRPLHIDAIAPGARLRLQARLLPGGVAADAALRGVALPLVKTTVVAGHATGEGQTEYDNSLVILLAA